MRPSLIRVEADEATYNLHILIRFEMEQALLNGDLPVADAPGPGTRSIGSTWASPRTATRRAYCRTFTGGPGWSAISPTYTLGNLYAAQFFAAADQELGGLHPQFARGEFQPLRNWLREKIHRHGQRYSAAELVKRVTGKELSSGPLLAHLRAKYGELYGV